MQSREFTQPNAESEILDEIDMSPSNLQRLSTDIDAKVGIEFEMVVPVERNSDDIESEPDLEYNDNIHSIDEILDFFRGENTRTAIHSVMNRLEDRYQSWVSDYARTWWDDNRSTGIYYFLGNKLNYVKKERLAIHYLMKQRNISQQEAEQVFESLSLSIKSSIVDTALHNIAKAVANNQSQYPKIYASARDYVETNFQDISDDLGIDPSEREFLADHGIHTMYDITNQFGLEWPYWTSGHYDNEESIIEDVALSFRNTIGRRVNWSADYHRAHRASDSYAIEPDSSIDVDDRDQEMGLEFISPPLKLKDILGDMKKVYQWATNRGCSTNKSTGLHINVSIADFNRRKLDYVKLALLLGDDYILEEFGRESNSYCTGAMRKIKNEITLRPEIVDDMLVEMRNGLNHLASRLIRGATTSKYTSIHVHDDYVEFRSPGGDWLNEDQDKITATLLRFIVALNAACDPDLYKQDYLKKLYKLLKPVTLKWWDPQDPDNAKGPKKISNDKGKGWRPFVTGDELEHYVRFFAGQMPKAALKSFVRQSVQKAKEARHSKSAENPRDNETTSTFDVYKVYKLQNGEQPEVVIGSFRVASGSDRDVVRNSFKEFLSRRNIHSLGGYGWRRVGGTSTSSSDDSTSTGSTSTGEFTGQWRIVDANNREVHRFGGIGNSQADANRFALRWLQTNDTGRGPYAVLPVMT